jgi:hypothetical protein
MASRHHTVPDLPVGHVELLSGNDAWHNAKAESERQRVLSRVKDNHHKDRFYLSNPNKNWGENELHRAKGVSAHPEKLRGGVFTSKAGQQFGFNRLKERVNELNIRASASFGQEANMPSPAKLPGKTDATAKIEEALSQLYDSVQASEYSNIQSNAQKVLSALYEGGDQLGSSLIADYSRNAFDIRRDMVALVEGPTEYTMEMGAFKKGDRFSASDVVKAKRRVKATLPVIDRILRLLDVIAKVANLSQPEKRQAIDASKGRDLREAEKRFVNTEALASPGMYDEGTTKAIRSPTGERTGTELEQGIRPIPEDTFDVSRARRYTNLPSAGDFMDGSVRSGTTLPSQLEQYAFLPDERDARYPQPEGSVSSSMEARQAQRPGFYEGPPAGRGKGGCHSCEEMEGGGVDVASLDPESAQLYRNRGNSRADAFRWREREKKLEGGGVGDGPLNEVSAKEMFRQKAGRYPNSDQELMEFMRKMNETSSMPVDGVFAPKGGRKKPMTARDRRLAGRGKPRETEASRLLKELDEADDDQLTGGSKKKNTSRHYV